MSLWFAGEKTPAKASFLLTWKEDQQARKMIYRLTSFVKINMTNTERCKQWIRQRMVLRESGKSCIFVEGKSCIENLQRILVRIQMPITAYLLEYQRGVNRNNRIVVHYYK